MHLAALRDMKEQTVSEQLRVFIHSLIHSFFIRSFVLWYVLLQLHSPFQNQVSIQCDTVLPLSVYSAIQYFLSQFTVSCLFLKVNQKLLTSFPSPPYHFYNSRYPSFSNVSVRQFLNDV